MDARLVYVPDADFVWLPRTLLSQDGTVVTVTTIEKDQPPTTVDLKPHEELMQRVNRSSSSSKKEENTDTWSLPMMNVGKVGLVGDMTLLGFLGEPQILYNLRHRFEHQTPYTATGDVIVAVNPYFRIPNLYGAELGMDYLQQAHAMARDGRVDKKLPPHVYSTSARAYADLLSKNINQSVLVSGESGAGKTETTKIMINFLVGSDQSSNQATKILGANPLLESFGNAKTVRNDNSSRFGKCTCCSRSTIRQFDPDFFLLVLSSSSSLAHTTTTALFMSFLFSFFSFLSLSLLLSFFLYRHDHSICQQ